MNLFGKAVIYSYILMSSSQLVLASENSSTGQSAEPMSIETFPDDILIHIFSFITPGQAVGGALTSQQFNRVACDPMNGPLSETNKADLKYEALSKFCTRTHTELNTEQAVRVAQKIASMSTNPVPGLINEENFLKAKLIALHFLIQNVPNNKGYIGDFNRIYNSGLSNFKKLKTELKPLVGDVRFSKLLNGKGGGF